MVHFLIRKWYTFKLVYTILKNISTYFILVIYIVLNLDYPKIHKIQLKMLKALYILQPNS